MEAPYLTCHDLSAGYDSQVLFQKLSFAVHPGERWGIVGPNGAGKSTIFKLIKGDLKPSNGAISIRNNVRVAYIDQKINFDDSLTVENILRQSLPLEFDTDLQLKNLEKEIERHTSLAEKNSNLYEDTKWLEKLHCLNEQLAAIGGTPTENIIQSALKLGFLVELASAAFKNLSGGQQKRVQIISALLKNPNLILLDEPTNHLDVQTVEWLEEFLLLVGEQGFSLFGFKSNEKEIEPVSFVLISHDRALLDTLVNKILEIEGGESKQYFGNYESYTEQKLENILVEEKVRAKMANTMRRELEWLRDGVRARTTKQTARIERAHALDKSLKLKNEKANSKKNAQMSFAAQITDLQRDKDDVLVTKVQSLGEQELIKLNSVTLVHPSKPIYLFENLNLIIKPRMRLAILGPNGCGKSTLIKAIADKKSPVKGEIKYHDLVKISYFDQKRNNLKYQETIRENISKEGDNVYFNGKYIHIMSYLERFLFDKYDANRIVQDLSGGEQARLLLAKIMLEQANLLILDEPTNDLDIPTLQILEKNLADFEGGIIFTSHDRYFMQKVATSILCYLGNSKDIPCWQIYPDLNQALEHLEKFRMENTQSPYSKKQESLSDKPEKKEEVGKKKKLSFKEQKEYDSLEKRIAEIEELIPKLSSSLEQAYAAAKNYEVTKELSGQIQKLQEELDACYVKWNVFL